MSHSNQGAQWTVVEMGRGSLGNSKADADAVSRVQGVKADTQEAWSLDFVGN